MNLTAEQEQALKKGQAIEITVRGTACLVMRKDVFERGVEIDYSPWTSEEIDLLAAEAADLLAGDGFDEPDNT